MALTALLLVHNRAGEFTRGMLVVDRRDDVGAYSPGDNRSVQYMSNQFRVPHAPLDPHVVPAPVLKEDDIGEKEKQGIGVFTLVETPGPGVCLDLLLRRIWGVPNSFRV